MKQSNLRHIPITKLVPSLITLLALCLGITSIRYAFDDKWVTASSLVIVATILDAIDGKIARLLEASSKFGAELDSLCDLISFGVAPAIIMYLWSLNDIPHKGVGWSIVLFFIACSAIRLARFNSNINNDDVKVVLIKPIADKKMLNTHFVGVPMPAGGIMAMLPMLLTFELMENVFSYWFVSVYIVIVGLLMVSKIRTFSLKSLYIPKEYVALTLALAAVIMIGMILEPWIIIPIMTLVYICSIPISFVYYKIHQDK